MPPHFNAIYSYQPLNRMTATSTSSMTCNANRNLTQKAYGSTTWTYTCDY